MPRSIRARVLWALGATLVVGLAAVGSVLVLAARTSSPTVHASLSDQKSGSSRTKIPQVAVGTWVPSKYPHLSNTGAYSSRRTISGRTITRDGTTLKNLTVNGQLTIRANHVTLKNVTVKSNSYYGILIDGKNTRITRTTVVGNGAMAGIAAEQGGQFVASGLDVFGSEDGVRLGSNCVLKSSLIHALRGHQGSHYDAVTADGFTGWQIVGNTILNPYNQTSAVTAGDIRDSGSQGLLRGNFLAGGGYELYSGPGIGSGLRIINNAFSTHYFSRGGSFGSVAHWVAANNTWTGNVWADGPRRGKAVSTRGY